MAERLPRRRARSMRTEAMAARRRVRDECDDDKVAPCGVLVGGAGCGGGDKERGARRREVSTNDQTAPQRHRRRRWALLVVVAASRHVLDKRR